MKTPWRIVLLVLVIVGTKAYFARRTSACSPSAFWPEPIFVNVLHPDLPIGSYGEGNLGVIQPAYASIYLYVAYRTLKGHPLQPSEQEALWKGDSLLLNGIPRSQTQPQETRQPARAAGETDWIGEWVSETGILPTGDISGDQFPPGASTAAGISRQVAVRVNGSVLYTNILNCTPGAFRTALDTYKARSGQFGASSQVVSDWLQAQRLVFDNCGNPGEIPPPLPTTAPALAQADRTYQIAAAHFYAGDYDQAAADFRAIGENSSSPWSELAPYLVARALVRKAMVDSFTPNLAVLAQAEAQLQAVVADPKQEKFHHAAEQLRGFVEFRLHPENRLAELANRLMDPRGDSELAQDSKDFELLSPIVTQRPSWGVPPPVTSKLYADLSDARAKSDLLDWILTLRLESPQAYNHALEKWETNHALPWLVAALTKATAGSPSLPNLLAACRQIEPSSPAYVSVTFQRLRLMTLEGRDRDARKELAHLQIDRLGPAAAHLSTPPSAVNLFLALRFKLARNLHEMLDSSPRLAATITSANSSKQMPEPVWFPNGSFDPNAPMLDSDALTVLNRFLPAGLLAEAAQSQRMPRNLRREIALAAWTRAAMLGKPSVARALGTTVVAFDPDLKASVHAYTLARSAAERRFAASLAMLRFPGLSPFIATPERWTPINQIDEYRNNWWGTLGPVCAPPSRFHGTTGYPPPPQWPEPDPALQSIYPGAKITPPTFLTAGERSAAARQWQEILAKSPAPDYLTREVLSWAKAHPADPRVPEALALAVKSTRVGCADQQTGAISKAAFDLLHRRYPKSTWAQQTPYWFKM